MSSFVNIIKEFDGSGDLLEAQREVLETLDALATAKAEGFSKEIELLLASAGTGVDKTVPISEIIDTKLMARAYTSDSASSIADNVKEAVLGFTEGGSTNIVNGIMKIISTALEVFLGSGGGSTSTTKSYFIFCDDFGIYRVDYMAWYRHVRATAIKAKVTQATGFAYAKSLVDITKITEYKFIALYGAQLNKENLSQEEIDAEITRLQKVWARMSGKASRTTDQALVAIQAHDEAQLEAGFELPLGTAVALIEAQAEPV